MKQKTLIQEITLYLLFLLIALFSFSFQGNSQTVKVTTDGNYIQIKDSRIDSVRVQETGKTYKTVNGEIFKVYQSDRGKLFIYRQSKSGKLYKYYLKIS